MSQYKYAVDVMTLNVSRNAECAERIMNERAVDNWELVNIVHISQPYMQILYFWKRQTNL